VYLFNYESHVNVSKLQVAAIDGFGHVPRFKSYRQDWIREGSIYLNIIVVGKNLLLLSKLFVVNSAIYLQAIKHLNINLNDSFFLLAYHPH